MSVHSTPHQGSDSVERPVARQTLRKLLAELLRTDADLDALCLDYFAHVYKRFGQGMDRLTKVNLLLELIEPAVVLRGLRSHYDDNQDALEIIEKYSVEPESEELRLASEQRAELDRLYLIREQQRLQNHDTSAITSEIVELKRKQRQRPQLQEGEVLSSRYRLLQAIGRGGFAKVWQAYDLKTQRIVAVKVLHNEHAEDARRMERFLRGARQMFALEHPHINRILDCPAEDHGFHYYVMDYMAGGDLHSRVVDPKIDRASAIQSIIQVGMALEVAHQRGIIHRDVKPQNILFDEQGSARLTDFDLVWAPDTTGGTHTTGLGTFLYAPPEQMEDASRIDQRADIYSLGMSAVFVLFGKALPRKALEARESFIEGLGCTKPMKALLQSATASEPDDRPSTVTEFYERFQFARVGSVSIAVTPTNTVSSLARITTEGADQSDKEQQSRAQVSTRRHQVFPSKEIITAERQSQKKNVTQKSSAEFANISIPEINQKTALLPGTAKQLYLLIRLTINRACKKGVLISPIHEVFKNLRYIDNNLVKIISYGEKDFRRADNHTYLKRSDGAYFHFVVKMQDTQNGLLLLGYTFELCFSDKIQSPQSLRYDFDYPDTMSNDDRRSRSHLHVGKDGVDVPTPIYSPVHLLELFIHGLGKFDRR